MANTLSKNQIEYFKNSKVRDENGNLIVCYHGTQTPGFTEFNPQHSDTSQFGKYKFDKYNVNYFTSDINVAKGYTELGVGDVEGERKNIYACYLNIENPFIVDNKTESEFKKWSNIKDNRVRDKHITAFEKFAKKWLHTWVDDSDVDAINKDLHFFNHELRPCADVDQDEDAIIYDLWELGNNSFFGAEHEVMRYYYIEELFSEDNYEELRDCLVGNYEEDREDYYYTIDNIVKWVLLMNEEDGTDYDGIIVPDIADVGPKGNPFSPYCTDYITLKSGNQIKDIKNINPTSKYNIHEDAGEKQVKIFKQIYNKIIQAEKYYGTPQWEDLLFSPLHCFIGAVLYAYHYSCKEKQSCIFHLGGFDNTATIISHCWIEDSSGRIHDTRGMSDKSRYNSFIEIPIDTNTDALSIIKLVKAVVDRKALIEELKESEIDSMNINEALTKLNNLDESLLQDLHRDNQHIKKVYGKEVYQALQEYCEQGNDLGNVLYTESGWKRFEKWLFNTKGINIKEPNNYQILENKNELKDRAKKHKKTDKKGARGWFVNPNAGDVEYNIGFLNKLLGNPSSAEGAAEAGGEISCGASIGESLQEALSNNIKIYETEKDGLPEVGRKFIAYRTTHKEYEIYTREDKEDIYKQGWSNVDVHISNDGEFYSGKSGWIYPIDYDRYIYLDELNLISPKTTEQDQLKQENVTKTIKTAFNEVFGTFGDKLAAAFTVKDKKGNVEIEFPFTLRDNALDINYLTFENEFKINKNLIEPMKANGLNDADIEKIFNTIFSYKWEEYYTRKNLATYKQTVLDKFTNKDKKESLNEKNLEKEENIIFKGFTIEHFPYKFVGGGKTIEHNSYIIRSPYCLKSPENEDKYYLPLYCENKDGEVINFNTLDQAKEYITKYISKKAGNLKIKHGDEVHFVLNKNLDESKKTEYEELYYPSLDIEIVTREGNPGGYYDSYMGQWYPDYSETEERTIDWTYYVRKEEIENLILEFMEDEGLDTELSPREFADIYDTYFDKYYDKILDAFRDEAIEDAEQNYREEDYIDWDSYGESFDKNLNENNEVEEEGSDNRYFDIEVALRKADLNYNYDYDSKFYFESKPDLEKACHLVRELGYEKYDRHESDLCLHINPELKEDFEDLDDPYADDIQKFVYKAISALKLRSKADREYYAEMLEHDIRNLRGEEWFEIFDKPKHASILAELKQLINYEEDEDMDENLKKNLNENQSLISFYHSSNNPNLSYDSLDWNKSSEIGLHVGTKQAAMERNNKYFYEIIVDKSKMKIFKAPYDMNYWYTVELAKKIKDETLFKEISSILYSYIHDREEDAFLESSKAYRDYFFKKGINTISYQNEYEDVESESYILLDKSMIVDVKPKGQTNEQLSESIEKHPTLNPVLWDENKKLIPIVNKTLNKIVKAFVDYCAENEVKLNVKDSVIVGSNANYNYTQDSDIDLHLIVDFDDEEQYKLYDAYKRLFNDKYDLTIKDIPVEIYVEKDLNSINSNGIYSLQNEWLKEPVQKEIPDIDEEKLQIELNKYLNKYKNIKPEDAESLIDLLYELRQKALSKQGEYAIGNLVFKEFRNKGYLDELKDLRDKYTSSILSLA